MADNPSTNAASQFTVSQFTVQADGDVWFITPVNDLASMGWCELPASASEILADAAKVAQPRVVFDLTGSTYFGSYFLGILVRCWKHISSRDGTLALCGVSDMGREVLGITSLDTLWEIYPNHTEAAKALASR